MAVRLIKGKYVADVYVGKKRVRRFFNTKIEAKKEELRLQIEEVDTGRQNPTDDISEGKCEKNQQKKPLNEAINFYVKTRSAQKCSETQVAEKHYFEVMYDFLWDQNIDAVSDAKLVHMELLQKALSEKMAASTVNRYFNTYRNFFSKCVAWEFTEKNPCAGLQQLKISAVKKKTLSDQAISEVIKHSESWFSDLMFFMAVTGVRNSEAANLKFNDVDLRAGVLFIKSSKGGNESIRRLPIHQDIAELIDRRKIQRRGYIGKYSDFVFLNHKGRPIQKKMLSREWHRVISKIDLDELTGSTPYCLRHTYITRLVEQGQNLELVRLLAGHTNLRTTQHYLHVGDGVIEAVAKENFESRKLRRCEKETEDRQRLGSKIAVIAVTAIS